MRAEVEVESIRVDVEVESIRVDAEVESPRLEAEVEGSSSTVLVTFTSDRWRLPLRSTTPVRCTSTWRLLTQ